MFANRLAMPQSGRLLIASVGAGGVLYLTPMVFQQDAFSATSVVAEAAQPFHFTATTTPQTTRMSITMPTAMRQPFMKPPRVAWCRTWGCVFTAAPWGPGGGYTNQF